MIRQSLLLAGVPVVLAVVVAVPLGFFHSQLHWLCAAVAIGVTVPPGVATLILAERMGRASPYGRVLALVVGTFVRMVVGFGGALIVFFASGDTFRVQPFVFFGWLLGAYLTTLATEMVILGGSKAGA